MKNYKKRGFTLIELVGCIAIIAILASLVWAMVLRAQTHARNTKVENDISETGKSISQYLTANDNVLSAVNASPGGGSAELYPGDQGTIWGIQKASAAAGPPPTHGDVYTGLACDTFSLLFNTTQAAHYYAPLPIPPTTFYTYSYRTSDHKPLANPCPGANDYHQDSALPDYTLVTNLDTADGVSAAYFWVNDGATGSGPASSIPAP